MFFLPICVVPFERLIKQVHLKTCLAEVRRDIDIFQHPEKWLSIDYLHFLDLSIW